MTHQGRPDDCDPIERVLAAFGLCTDAQVEAISTGLIHASFAVREPGAEYILQRFNPIFSLRVLDNIAAVTAHLSDKGITTFQLLRSQTGQAHVDLGEDGRWRLMTRLAGTSFDRCHSPEQAHSAGALVSSFHSAMCDFETKLHPIGWAFHETAHHLEELRTALREHPEHPLFAEVQHMAGHLFEEAPSCLPDPDLPLRVIHGDLKFNNLLFEGPAPPANTSALALIDFDTLSRMPLCFDWGDAWRSWCNTRPEDDPEADLDMAIFRAASEGMMGSLRLSLGQRELQSLSYGLELLSLELATRFATDALCERHWAWDPKRFGSAGEHNLSRARGQLSLYHQAVETHDERARFLQG